MTDELYTRTENGVCYWTREELLVRAETAEAERDKTAEQLERTVFGLIEWMKRAESAEKR